MALRGIICFLVLSFAIPFLYAGEAGWMKVCTRKSCYYKPFARIEASNFVLFVFPTGRVYRGKCRRIKGRSCIATTKKRFHSSADPFTYIELTRGYPPEVVSYGGVSPFDVRDPFVR